MELLLHIVYFVLLNLVIVVSGYLILKEKMVLQSWMLLATGIYIVYAVFLHEAPVIKMLAIIATTFAICKGTSSNSD